LDSKEVIKRLKREGFNLRGVSGSHHQFKHKDGRLVTVAHPKKDIPLGTLKNIFDSADWNWKSTR